MRNVAVILLLALCLISCFEQKRSDTLFSLVPASETGIRFSNDLVEDEQFNIVEYLYFYNGGGVACGDINNDGLIDIYFSSNQHPNRLYINKGNLKFEDITTRAGVQGIGNWKTGVTMADVNGDGFLDIYVCGVGGYKGFNSKNQLLINNGDETFTDRTEELGLNYSGRSTQAIFFDYDLDGDLDCYLLNHSVQRADSYISISHRLDSDSLNGDRLFRNDLIDSDGKKTTTHFVNVTKEAGIFSSRLGYGLGIGVSDINLDGYPDIYVSNDFQENDYLYLNNGNGTFSQIMEKSMAHTSRFSMGVDIADFNNDGRSDVVTMDMLPRDEAIIKTSAGEDGYEVYKYKLKYGYHYQVARNCLQLNRIISDTSVLFSDIALQAGVAATDWSWSPLLADFDNDGLKDLYVSNGILRRPNDMDYINFISSQAIQDSLKTINKEDMSILNKMPVSKVSSFIFKNDGQLGYIDQSKEWGIKRISVSNGAAYADLDNDGDVELITNNLREGAFLYNNMSDTVSSRHLKVSFKGKSPNSFGLGSKVLLYAGSEKFYYEVSSSRGFCSSSDTRVNAGLGSIRKLDSVTIIWPSGTYQTLRNVSSNTSIVADESKASGRFNYKSLTNTAPLLQSIQKNDLPDFIHQEDDFNAFNNEGLMPHMLTTQGPPLAKGDINGDGLDDIFVGGGKGQTPGLFIQTPSQWKKQSIDFSSEIQSEDIAAEFFDADGDRDLDLVVVSGGQNADARPEDLRPRLYINDGKGNLALDRSAMPDLMQHASCVKACDFDKDGDIDLFVGSSVIPFLYGMAPPSYLLVNDGKGKFSADKEWLGNSQFDNVSKGRPGMIKDAVWTDINLDGYPDLIAVGEWMPITILIQNRHHKFDNQTEAYGMSKTSGWWNCIIAADVDHDGDDDYIAGNLGFNSRLKTSPTMPVRLYVGDFDSNGGSDHIITYYNDGKNYPFASRDQLVKQLPGLKKKFLKYKDYRNVNLEDIITPKQKGNSVEMHTDVFASSFIRNDRTSLVRTDLPLESQMAPVYAVAIADINGDSFEDILLGGNLVATQPDYGPYDASIGQVLSGDGKGNWKAIDPMISGFVVTGEIRDIQIIKSHKNSKLILVSRNNKSITGFKLSK